MRTCLSVCPSVCLVRARSSKTEQAWKSQNRYKRFFRQELSGVPIFSSKGERPGLKVSFLHFYVDGA